MFGFQMIQEMDNLQREMEQIFRGLNFAPAFPALSQASALKLRDVGEAFVVTATLPGIDSDKLDISILNRQLNLSGEFAAAEVPETAIWHRRERNTGRFERSLQLPVNVDADQVEAEYKQGILSIRLPKAASELPKKISVKAG
ncbi:MAG: Hsp20/alpha crystallin family protein [Deltaproteobacteria bacterium]|nr:Hsp20/alpha crystallin family protein [Deltaproteobacteria bacterium]